MIATDDGQYFNWPLFSTLKQKIHTQNKNVVDKET